ncbi:hypothetical protein L195_g060055 [Trifolium pratense]|uniref:Uncharacterized protein n=1 Tax=Trifolium pratense TaxID=57577 RepID=A0A2K3K1J5_TRIPR|nr:hypothetical protein L195_g060055 [Trifolium pratense]
MHGIADVLCYTKCRGRADLYCSHSIVHAFITTEDWQKNHGGDECNRESEWKSRSALV